MSEVQKRLKSPAAKPNMNFSSLLLRVCMFVVAVLLLFSIYLSYPFSFASKGSVSRRYAVVCFQKNELSQLSFWIEYHALLLGATNVAVVDNFSNDNETLKILSDWSSKGVRVLYNQGPYTEKGILTAAALKELFPTHEVAIPMDADEILVSYRSGLPQVNASIIREDLEVFRKSAFPCLGLKQYYGSIVMAENGTSEGAEYVTKTIYSDVY